jgi:hypothetical protein
VGARNVTTRHRRAATRAAPTTYNLVLAAPARPSFASVIHNIVPPSLIASRLSLWWNGLSARSCSTNKGKRNAGRRVSPTSAPYGARHPPSEPSPYKEGTEGGSPVGVPPRRLRQRTNATAQLQNALPGTWSKTGVTRLFPVPVQRQSRRPVIMPAGRLPEAAREQSQTAVVILIH